MHIKNNWLSNLIYLTDFKFKLIQGDIHPLLLSYLRSEECPYSLAYYIIGIMQLFQCRIHVNIVLGTYLIFSKPLLISIFLDLIYSRYGYFLKYV